MSRPSASGYDKVQNEESLLGETAPSVAAVSIQQCIEVVAPSTLQQGYVLPVVVDGKEAFVAVPQGGVQAGDKFLAPFTFENPQHQQQHEQSSASNKMSVPVGHWRDTTFDCCNQGFYHPLWVMSCLCPILSLGQVMTRFNLDIKGNRRIGSAANSTTFRLLFVIFMIRWIVMKVTEYTFRVLAPGVPEPTTEAFVKEDEVELDAENMTLRIDDYFDLAFGAYIVFMMFQTRAFLDGPRSFKTMLGVFAVYFFWEVVVAFAMSFFYGIKDAVANPSGEHAQRMVSVPGSARAVAYIYQWEGLIWIIFVLVLGMKTRSLVRKTYGIPVSVDVCDGQLEDCCCVCFCQCCAFAQMSRHTADYNAYPFDYGAEDGLPEGAPEVV